MVGKSAIFAVLRRRLFIVQIDVPKNIIKKSKTIPRLNVQKVRKMCYAAASISRYRLINVAPSYRELGVIGVILQKWPIIPDYGNLAG